MSCRHQAMFRRISQGVLLFCCVTLLSHCGSETGSVKNGTDPAVSPNPPPVTEPQSPNLHFFTFGDWGSGDANQMAVADRADALCQAERCDFGLFLGDNFYDHGVSSADDPQWDSKYRDVYPIRPSLQIPWYAVLGNHDWDGVANAQAQVDFDLLDKDPYWRMPAFNYSVSMGGSMQPLLEIFVINSNQFDTAAQGWLLNALNASQASWKILAFHHPIFNNGSVHPDDEKGIYPSLKPLICGKVDLLLSGHEHLFSHLRDSADPCGYDQLIVGTGGKAVYSSQPDARTIFTDSSLGVADFTVDSARLQLRFYRANGDPSYEYSWTH